MKTLMVAVLLVATLACSSTGVPPTEEPTATPRSDRSTDDYPLTIARGNPEPFTHTTPHMARDSNCRGKPMQSLQFRRLLLFPVGRG